MIVAQGVRQRNRWTSTTGVPLWWRCGYGITMASMAIPKIKATYSLDPDTVDLLERLAERWKVSKSEALRRAIRSAASAAPTVSSAEAALDRWQGALGVSEKLAAAWGRQARSERRASSKKRGG